MSLSAREQRKRRAPERFDASHEKRDLTAESAAQTARDDEHTRCKDLFATLVEEYICPITKELPIDPVIAGDGMMYEKSAVSKWLRQNKRSPLTGLRMGERLVTSTQLRNTIEQLVSSGVIDSEKAATWKAKRENYEKLQQYSTEAKQGDADAMYELGQLYVHGQYNIVEDLPLARKWFKRGTYLQNARCMAAYGEFCIMGSGGVRRLEVGMMYVSWAAIQGSDMAAFVLAKRLRASGDHLEAKYWCEQVMYGCCTHKHLTATARDECAQLAQSLSCESSSSSSSLDSSSDDTDDDEDSEFTSDDDDNSQ